MLRFAHRTATGNAGWGSGPAHTHELQTQKKQQVKEGPKGGVGWGFPLESLLQGWGPVEHALARAIPWAPFPVLQR